MSGFEFKNKKKYVNLCKKISELPPNLCCPWYFSEIALGMFEEGKVKDHAGRHFRLIKELDVHNGRVVEIIHTGSEENKDADPIVLIGKGVCFDMGGNNIKTGKDTHEMKFDKCGAAAVLAVMKACKDNKYPHPVKAFIPLIYNMPGQNCVMPGSVFEMKGSGIKVEVRDTDAEGRLIIADCLNHMTVRWIKARHVITVATLTGACAYALGEEYSGLYSNDNRLLYELKEASKDCEGDSVWPMPLSDKHLKMLTKTKCADIMNYCGKELGGSVAAAFIGYFAKHFNWAHLDIAGTAWKEQNATGRPVNLLLKHLEIEAKHV
jgi:leucyl aminopeptidase